MCQANWTCPPVQSIHDFKANLEIKVALIERGHLIDPTTPMVGNIDTEETFDEYMARRARRFELPKNSVYWGTMEPYQSKLPEPSWYPKRR
jgi:hypothetical protein